MLIISEMKRPDIYSKPEFFEYLKKPPVSKTNQRNFRLNNISNDDFGLINLNKKTGNGSLPSQICQPMCLTH